MTATLDRGAFYDAVRKKPFGGKLTQAQVTGMNAMLDACPVDFPTDHLAYAFATSFHETARTMLPIKEYGGDAYFTKMYDVNGSRPSLARKMGNVNPGDGPAFAGRGYVQLTWRSNYRKATKRLCELGLLADGLDLEANPRLALEPGIAAAILFIGMAEGWFTGKKLSDYFRSGKADWREARRIINGTDKAATIASYGQAFQAALKVAGHKPGAVTAKVETPKVDVAPLAAPPTTEGLSEAAVAIDAIGAPPNPAETSWWGWAEAFFKRPAA